jgi:hypothetical protein
MKITVSDARAFAAALNQGADEAMEKGEHEFDLVTVVQSVDDKAREDLQAAIEAARQSGG